MSDLNVSLSNTGVVRVRLNRDGVDTEYSVSDKKYIETRRCKNITDKNGSSQQICLTEIDFAADPRFRGERKKLSATEGIVLSIISSAASQDIKQAEALMKTDPAAAIKLLESSKAKTELGEVAYANIRQRGMTLGQLAVPATPAPAVIALKPAPEKLLK
jgi:hypothetical protein